MANQSVSLKLLIDTKANKVLFAEAGKDFVDFLFNILALPLGSVIRLLTKEAMVGCLGNLYQSIENLSQTYMQPNLDRNTLLEPKTLITVTNNSPLLLPSAASKPRNFYLCNNCYNYVATDSSANCPQCNRKCMNRPVTFAEESEVEKTKAASSGEGGGGYVKGVVTYMVMDDLVVKPMSTISSITLLNKFNIKDLGALEERVIDFGIDEAINLLKSSLQSKTVLTGLFLNDEKGSK